MGTHHTLINGTSYAISGGTDLIAGTSYQIRGGRTLVDGTAYKIGFGRSCIIEITAVRGNGSATVTINGITYKAAATLEVESGTEIECLAEGSNLVRGKITVNGDVVAEAVGSQVDANYTYLVETDTQIYLNGSPFAYQSEINITTK